jgi:23S rRNA G2445 N2-methylase RlmL
MECCSIEDLKDTTSYDVLLTCPPYGNKEIWLEDQNCLKGDDYIKMCLQKIKAKKYIFVVDETYAFSDYIKENVERKSHMAASKEVVVVIMKDDLQLLSII